MKHLTILIGVFAAIMGLLLACSTKKQETPANTNNENRDKVLVCYFSATGTTEKAAKRIADLTGGTLHNIEPAELYTDADLNWRDSLSRSYVEMHNRSFRPALKDSVTDMTDYSVVFIGYPNWWNTHPTIINTFIEANDLQGKTVIPFMTSGGSNIINSENELHEAYPSIRWGKGRLMNNISDDDIKDWLNEIGL
ncbi:flavodoxin [uncultured Muribaculum sp.]|uniref:flavodoxin n=1 Tax=uncultured Muribaculum sp. TaxID=1918613 RepID=UPI00272F4B28|nr:flavodoxin [uncultured Muribaculum sp.]